MALKPPDSYKNLLFGFCLFCPIDIYIIYKLYKHVLFKIHGFWAFDSKPRPLPTPDPLPLRNLTGTGRLVVAGSKLEPKWTVVWLQGSKLTSSKMATTWIQWNWDSTDCLDAGYPKEIKRKMIMFVRPRDQSMMAHFWSFELTKTATSPEMTQSPWMLGQFIHIITCFTTYIPNCLGNIFFAYIFIYLHVYSFISYLFIHLRPNMQINMFKRLKGPSAQVVCDVMPIQTTAACKRCDWLRLRMTTDWGSSMKIPHMFTFLVIPS